MIKKLLFIALLCIPLTAVGVEYDKIYKGKYTWGHEVDVFQSCASKKTYWVSASSWVHGPLLDFYKSAITKPYQPIYIEFRGHILDEEVDGFAANYDGLIRASEIKKKALVIPKECK